MLLLVDKISKLHFSKLMQVYAESNRENADEMWQELPAEQRIARVEQDFYTYLRDVFFGVEGSFYCIWEENGRYISALRLEPYRDGLLLEALETEPTFRQRGYAQKLMRAVVELLAEKNVNKLCSHVGKKNIASLATHAQAGFRRISETATYIDGSVNAHCCTLMLKISE